MNKTKHILTILLLFVAIVGINANNISISRSLKATVSAPQELTISFGVQWDNSWKYVDALEPEKTNWDAAWVFVKYQLKTHKQKGWFHVYFSPNSSDIYTRSADVTTPAIYKVGYNNDKTKAVGLFVYRQDEGQGYYNVDSIAIKWKGFSEYNPSPDNGTSVYSLQRYGAVYTIQSTDEDLLSELDFRVFAVEMVYIPEGAFWLGDGGPKSLVYADNIKLYNSNTAEAPPVQQIIPAGAGAIFTVERMTKNTPVKLNQEENIWHCITDVAVVAQRRCATLNDTFPKGYQAIYCAKYEITQIAYVDFLNCLTYDQQQNLTAVVPSSAAGTFAMVTASTPEQYRNFIKIKTPGKSIDGTPAEYGLRVSTSGNNWDPDSNGGHIACNFMMWQMGVAWSDFAGLRPMTELEYEKICRGVDTFYKGEYAWGNANRIDSKNPGSIIISPNMINELCDTLKLANYRQTDTFFATAQNFDIVSMVNPLTPPIRVGAFARETTKRREAGASYWGVMNMSDNLFERVVTIDYAKSGNFASSSLDPETQSRVDYFCGSHGDGDLDKNTGFATNKDWSNKDNKSSSSLTQVGVGIGFKQGKISDRPDAFVGTNLYKDNMQLKGTEKIRSFGFRAVRTEEPRILENKD
ncbi:hypothetical protein FACS1894153_0040 [Bacteroidia bacterium]|nr:hypothetical protein FACS1894153_0040 [Bacteroidia bacterium]